MLKFILIFINKFFKYENIIKYVMSCLMLYKIKIDL